MSQSLLADALAAGVTVVTPTNRLARDVAARFDAARRAEGKCAWSAPQAVPWTLWLDRLWLSALAQRAVTGRVLLDASAARELWYAVIKSDLRRLLNPRGAARHAMEAWTLFHAWRMPRESLRDVAARAHGDDALAFAAWADVYQKRLDALEAIDPAQVPDIVAAVAPRLARTSGRVLLHGFLTMTPQQNRLIAALRAAGVAVDDLPLATRAGARRNRASAPTAALEAAQALAFARARLSADRSARIAIVVANLQERRDEIIALAEEILCPERLLSLAADAPRPYGVSLGEALGSVPIVACALALIALASTDVEATVAAAVVRAPFLPDAATRWAQRATVEREWRGSGRREVGWPDVVAALRTVEPTLHRRFSAAVPPSRAPRLPREWARLWSDWLVALGWPGTSTLTSAQWQARDAWSSAMAQFAATGAVTGALPPAVALETLRALLDETLFQPEAPPAPVQILGSLEAVGLSFDCAWLAGFDALRWPPSVAPSPFLPIAWQYTRGVPRAHPDSALANARELTAALSSLASEVIVSHAEAADDAPSVISPLFADWPRLDIPPDPRAARLTDAADAAVLERIDDDRAPALAAGTYVRGGAQLFESQSACPFQAVARYRLGVEAWAPCPDGLSAAERGIVLHAMLTAFWDDVLDHATLAAFTPAQLTERVDASIEAGKAKLPPARWRALPPAVADAEAHRLAATLQAWIVEGELPRPPFAAQAHEQAIELDVDGVGVRVRVDRIDALESGGIAIVDYKSGRVVSPSRWFASRPEGIQLAVYAQAVEGKGGEPIRALAFAQLKAGEIRVSGLADAHETWPALDVAGETSRVPVQDWANARMQLRDHVAMLAREIREGVARVAPRRPTTCQYCGLQPLCRIRMLDDRAAPADLFDE